MLACFLKALGHRFEVAFDLELADRVGLAFDQAGIVFESKKMMGGLCYMVNSKMALGIIGEELMVRISPEKAHHFLETDPICRPMDFTGKAIKGFLYVEAEALQSLAQVDRWVKEALAFNPQAKRSKKRSE